VEAVARNDDVSVEPFSVFQFLQFLGLHLLLFWITVTAASLPLASNIAN